MSPYIGADLARLVRKRAGNVCEYCCLPQSSQEATFHVDHIQPPKDSPLRTTWHLLACASVPATFFLPLPRRSLPPSSDPHDAACPQDASHGRLPAWLPIRQHRSTEARSNGTRLRFWTMISVGIARLLPPRSLPPWWRVHNQNVASVAPSPPCGLSAWSGVSAAFSREHRSTEASSVVAWRRRWVAFWWRTALDGGKPRRGGTTPLVSLTSCHSGLPRWFNGFCTTSA